MTYYDYQIYRLVDPRYPVEHEDYVRYVGRTRHHLRTRLNNHWALRDNKGDPKASWLKDLESEGLRPEIQLVETVNLPMCGVTTKEGDWAERHKRVGYNLLNIRHMDRVAFPDEIHDPIKARQELNAATEESRKKTELHTGFAEHIQWRNRGIYDLEQAVLDKIERGEITGPLAETLKKTISEMQPRPPTSIASNLDEMPALKLYVENAEKYGEEFYVKYMGKLSRYEKAKAKEAKEADQQLTAIVEVT